MKKLSPQNKWNIVFIAILATIQMLILLMLFFFQVIESIWISGWFLGFFTFIFAVYFGEYSVKLLVRSENYYFFYFLFLIKIGVYATPFLVGIFFSNVFSVFGTLVGFSGIILIPYVRYIFKNINNKLSTKKEEIESVT